MFEILAKTLPLTVYPSRKYLHEYKRNIIVTAFQFRLLFTLFVSMYNFSLICIDISTVLFASTGMPLSAMYPSISNVCYFCTLSAV